MEFIVQNLGAIKKATIDLGKDFIILCGPNNTGKTYIAHAIYGLIRLKGEYKIPFPENIENNTITLFKKGVITINCLEFFTEEKLQEILSQISITYKEILPDIFATTKEFFATTELSLTIKNAELIREDVLKREYFQEKRLGSEGHILQIRKSLNSSELLCTYIVDQKEEDGQFLSLTKDILKDNFVDMINEFFFNTLFPDVYIASFERTYISINKALSTIRKRSQHIKRGERREKGYPLPLREGLRISSELNFYKRNTKKFAYLAEEIESKFLQGQVFLADQGDIQFHPDNSTFTALDIHLASSVVQSLANLVFYFKHLADPHDLLIIDEPELNLHPDLQVAMARLLAKMVNSGFKVMISTHSDYLIRELNNQIMLYSQFPKSDELMNKYGYTKNEILSPDQVGVYLFDKQSGNVNTVTVSETGFEVATIDNVIHQQNQASQEIYYTLYD